MPFGSCFIVIRQMEEVVFGCMNMVECYFVILWHGASGYFSMRTFITSVF